MTHPMVRALLSLTSLIIIIYEFVSLRILRHNLPQTFFRKQLIFVDLKQIT